jgi:hypothetical protein
MITLAADCLLFQLSNGESVPFSADMISVELMGDSVKWLDSELVKQAAKAVFHYFKHELGRQSVTTGDFAVALEKVLRGFRLNSPPKPVTDENPSMLESDLCQLARETGEARELVFFPRLREELRLQLKQGPEVLRFHGLRGCVKHLVGAERWGLQCRSLEEQIVEYLRQCLNSEAKPAELALIIH